MSTRVIKQSGVHLRFVRPAAIAAVAFCGMLARGHAKARPDADSPESVIVPYDVHKPIDPNNANRVYLPYDHFVQLWEAAKRHRRGESPEQPKCKFVLESARYDGTLSDGFAEFSALINLSTFRDSWVSVPVTLDNVQITSVKLDGAVASLENGKLLVESPGRHTLEVLFRILREKDATSLDWRIPKTAGTLVSLALPNERTRATFEASSGTVEDILNGQNTVSAVLGRTGRIHIDFDSSVVLSRLTQPASAEIIAQLQVHRATEEFRTRYAFAFEGAQEDRFTVSLDPSLALIDLQAPDLKSWKLTRDRDCQLLEIQLNAAVKDRFVFSLVAERVGKPGTGSKTFPRFGALAQRVEHRASFYAEDEVTVRVRPGQGVRQVVSTDEAPADLHAYGAFAYVGLGSASGNVENPGGPAGTPTLAVREAKPELRYEVEKAPVRWDAKVNYVYQLNRQKIDLMASLSLDAKGRKLLDTTFAIPPGFDVQALQSARLKDWWRSGDVLHVRFDGETPDKTSLVVYLVQAFKNAPTKLELNPLVAQDFQTVTGEAVVAADKTVKTSLELSPGAKEIDPANAAHDFAILPPLERKRAFSYKSQDFHGSVSLETLPAKTTTTWVMAARVHEAWLDVSTHIELKLRQGSVDHVKLKLPGSAPEARISGNDIREVTSKVEGDNRIYDVVFQNAIYDKTEFNLAFDAPLGNGLAASLPSIDLDESAESDGYVLVDNVSDDEMEVQPTNVEQAQPADVPFLPDLSPGAKLFHALPGWHLKVATSHLEKSAGRAAFVAWAEITTGFRRNGTEWNRAVYHLKNRSLQFLPVKLPDEGQLLSARVAGQSVRADEGQVQGQKVVLIPLLKTNPGDLSYDVEVVYRITDRKPLGSIAHRVLHDPSLIGITVEKTLWNVALPEAANLFSASGNMEPVVEELARTEKLEDALQELKSLGSSIISAPIRRAQASRANFEALAKQVQDGAQDLDSSGRKEYSFPLTDEKYLGKKAEEQKNRALARRKAIESELAQETSQIAKAEANSSTVFTAPSKERGTISWKENTEYAGKLTANAPQAAPSISAAGNVFLNDNVLLQNQVTAAPATRQVQADEGGSQAKFKLQLAPQRATEASPEIVYNNTSLNRPPSQLDAAAKDTAQNVYMSTARASVVNRLASAASFESGGGASRVTVRGGLVTSNIDEPTRKELFEKLERSWSVPVKRFSAGGTAAVAAPAPQEQLQPAGRISLPVDFPLEGGVLHFKKVKAKATLDLWITEPAAFDKLWWFLKFLVAAAVLAVVFKFVDRHAAKRSSGEAEAA